LRSPSNVVGLELPDLLVAEITRLLPAVFREFGFVGSRIWESAENGTRIVVGWLPHAPAAAFSIWD
jgi:hypothetical protein